MFNNRFMNSGYMSHKIYDIFHIKQTHYYKIYQHIDMNYNQISGYLNYYKLNNYLTNFSCMLNKNNGSDQIKLLSFHKIRFDININQALIFKFRITRIFKIIRVKIKSLLGFLLGNPSKFFFYNKINIIIYIYK